MHITHITRAMLCARAVMPCTQTMLKYLSPYVEISGLIDYSVMTKPLIDSVGPVDRNRAINPRRS